MRALSCLLALLGLLVAVGRGEAAALAAADQVGGYSGQVLEKVAKVWQPPADAGEHQVRIAVKVDGDGQVVACRPVAASSLAAMDKSACAAVREAGNLGVPPYALPVEFSLTFWTGQPRGAARDAQTAKAPPTARDAQAARDIQAARDAAAREAQAAKDAQAARERQKEQEAAKARQVEADYVKTALQKIRPQVIIPAQTPKGTWSVMVAVSVNEKGRVTGASLGQSCGNAALDTSVLRAVLRTGVLPSPPGKKARDLHLTFVVKRK